MVKSIQSSNALNLSDALSWVPNKTKRTKTDDEIVARFLALSKQKENFAPLSPMSRAARIMNTRLLPIRTLFPHPMEFNLQKPPKLSMLKPQEPDFQPPLIDHDELLSEPEPESFSEIEELLPENSQEFVQASSQNLSRIESLLNPYDIRWKIPKLSEVEDLFKPEPQEIMLPLNRICVRLKTSLKTISGNLDMSCDPKTLSVSWTDKEGILHDKQTACQKTYRCLDQTEIVSFDPMSKKIVINCNFTHRGGGRSAKNQPMSLLHFKDLKGISYKVPIEVVEN